MTGLTGIGFFRKLTDGSEYRLGTAIETPNGWRFISNVSSHKNSRKDHRTMKKCLPRWIGYPNKCTSRATNQQETKCPEPQNS